VTFAGNVVYYFQTGKERAMVNGILIAVLSIGLGVSTLAGTSDDQTKSSPATSCDSVCQIKAQDMAFALLLETFREFKGCRIEQQYQTRLEGAETLPTVDRKSGTSLVLKSDTEAMKKLQEFVRMLARTERNLEMEGLQTQIVNFENAYKCMRRVDETQLGITVSNTANLRVAAKQLKEFVIVSQGVLSSTDFQPTAPIPADAVLLDVEPAIPSPSGLIESCD
jgi:hypothetical protein